ncbi:TetR/AcrR family transcriptional regulator [Amycolatopsis sp. NBC_00345]|uniref:TetR/AcrR family transcriptional regulator n=1 Tax=Amycolatopsis sp. NBC_00345 TaxID=2975955 RepID=UPI002E256564
MKDVPAGPQPVLRKDAARNRRYIVDAARALAREGKPIQLNAVAKAADVGVGTVYRHFPTPEALVEAVASDRFVSLIRQAEEAAGARDAEQALRVFLKAAVTAYLQDDTFASAVMEPDPATPDIRDLRERLQDGLRGLLARTAADGGLRPDLTAADVMALLCGVGFAVRHSPDRDDPGLPDRYLGALLDGALGKKSR